MPASLHPARRNINRAHLLPLLLLPFSQHAAATAAGCGCCWPLLLLLLLLLLSLLLVIFQHLLVADAAHLQQRRKTWGPG